MVCIGNVRLCRRRSSSSLLGEVSNSQFTPFHHHLAVCQSCDIALPLPVRNVCYQSVACDALVQIIFWEANSNEFRSNADHTVNGQRPSSVAVFVRFH